MTADIPVPVWANKALTLLLVAGISAMMGYQLKSIAELAALQTRETALEKRVELNETNLIGVRRYEDFERRTDQELLEIKRLIEDHDHESGTRIHQMEQDMYGFSPKIKRKPQQ